MSIYCTTFAIGFEHKPRCARIKKVRAKLYEQDDSKPCTCGSSPLAYKGSHVLPTKGMERGGSLDLGAIPGYIRRHRDGGRKFPYRPWLRVSVDGVGDASTVLLSRRQVKELRDALGAWLELSALETVEKAEGRE